jgi:hypothetical protein
VGVNKMTYKNTHGEVWSMEKGDWISSKYYDKQELVKQIRKRNLILVGSFAVYLVIGIALIFF